ncbi:hypothetical protein FRC08_000456 [Ceratobasidium sp. 394]|nr:hypothetical protein FRC08_000456 [Ceratobasidium sp. 394]
MTDELLSSNCTKDPIAGGGYGDVFQACLSGNRKVAIKCPRIFEQTSHSITRGEVMKWAAHEMYAASKLDHPNILRVIGVAHFRNRVAIVSPWMDNGGVVAYLNANPNADPCVACTQVSKGLSYMHQLGIVHGDLKGANILVSRGGVAQITDFGNTILSNYSLHFTGVKDAGGLSMRWTPLEILDNKTGASQPGDVYALGMTILVGAGSMKWQSAFD